MTHSLAWVTPLSGKSDIGAFSRNLLVEFAAYGPANGISPSVVVNEHGPTYWTDLPTIPLTGGAADQHILSAFDFKIFNIGNNAECHHYINQLALRLPGVVVVHDLVMQHYLSWQIFERRRRPEMYARLMAEYYGSTGLDIVGSSRICSTTHDAIYAPWDTPHVSATPLIEPFVQSAAAIVVHSAFAESLVRPMFDGPLLRLQLPWDKKPSLDDAQLEAWAKATKNRGRCTVTAFGHISRNKCLELVLQACAESNMLREHARLVIAGYPGDVHYVDQLKLMVSHLGLGHMVEFEFSVSEQRLGTLQREADIFVNLRYPNTESASGSLIEQMNAGKPVMIYPTGAYAEVDDRAAVKVDRAGGVGAVIAALERLTADPAARVRIGKAGRAFVRRMGRREYVQQLCSFLLHNEPLLHRRAACMAGRSVPAHLPVRQEVGVRWAEALDRTRWLFGGLHGSDIEIDMRVFLDWDDTLLRRYIVIGLFGHLEAGVLDEAMRSMLDRCDRWQIAQAVSSAYLLARICRGTTAHLPHLAHLVGAAPVIGAETWHVLSALDATVFIRCCYLGLLGRMPAEGEADRYVVRMVHESARNVVREFIASDEFRQRGVAADALAGLHSWCESGPTTPVECQQIAIGVPVGVGTDNPETIRMLTAGWHKLEPHGVWSRSLVSGLRFKLPDIGTDGRLALAITGRVPAVTAERPRSGTVTCNDAPPTEWVIDHDDWFTLRIGLPPFPNGSRQVNVAISCHELVNPAALNLGPDDRNLGFCLREFQVSPDAGGN